MYPGTKMIKYQKAFSSCMGFRQDSILKKKQIKAFVSDLAFPRREVQHLMYS